jgi:hypothetical protein
MIQNDLDRQCNVWAREAEMFAVLIDTVAERHEGHRLERVVEDHELCIIARAERIIEARTGAPT